MKREELIHIVRASAEITGEDRFVIVGSQSILGSIDEPPAAMTFSREADIYPKNRPEKAILIDGAIGEGSAFESSFGYYAHGIGPETAKLPGGWEDRVVEVAIETLEGRTVIAECPEVHDLLLAKCAADREHDWEFVEVAMSAGLCDSTILIERADSLPIGEKARERVKAMVRGLAARSRLDDP